MRLSLIILCLMLLGSLSAQSADTLYVLSAPQFTNPFYKAFSQNYLGVEAAGRGYTSAALLGTAQNALINPATMMVDSARVFTEINIKPPVEAEGLIFDSRYSSPMPFALTGISFSLGKKMAAAICYSNPKSLVLDDFSLIINQGAALVSWVPKYYLHQISAISSYDLTPQIKLGLSIHNQIHYVDDVIFLHTYDRVQEYNYALRFQPGVLYHGKALAWGLSAVIPTQMDWDLTYANYDVELPLELSTGLSYTIDNYRFATDFNFSQDSTFDDSFSDRYSFHLGAEQRNGNKILRAGYFFASNVWDGQVLLPENTGANADSSIFWQNVSPTLPVKDNAQHFISAGYGYLFRDGSLNLSGLGCVAGGTKTVQINLSLSLYLNAFKREDFLKFR